MIETCGLVAAVEAADAMVKAAQVSLLGQTRVGGGLITVTVSGDVGAVQAAVDAGAAAASRVRPTGLIAVHVIPRPEVAVPGLLTPAKTTPGGRRRTDHAPGAAVPSQPDSAVPGQPDAAPAGEKAAASPASGDRTMPPSGQTTSQSGATSAPVVVAAGQPAPAASPPSEQSGRAAATAPSLDELAAWRVVDLRRHLRSLAAVDLSRATIRSADKATLLAAIARATAQDGGAR
jgi:hypothetical protein